MSGSSDIWSLFKKGKLWIWAAHDRQRIFGYTRSWWYLCFCWSGRAISSSFISSFYIRKLSLVMLFSWSSQLNLILNDSDHHWRPDWGFYCHYFQAFTLSLPLILGWWANQSRLDIRYWLYYLIAVVVSFNHNYDRLCDSVLYYSSNQKAHITWKEEKKISRNLRSVYGCFNSCRHHGVIKLSQQFCFSFYDLFILW